MNPYMYLNTISVIFYFDVIYEKISEISTLLCNKVIKETFGVI